MIGNSALQHLRDWVEKRPVFGLFILRIKDEQWMARPLCKQTDQCTYERTNGRTKPLIESRVRG